MRTVETFNKSVKATSEKASETVMIMGRLKFRVSPDTEPPIIIGRSGKTHGARMVSMPAINAPNNKNI